MDDGSWHLLQDQDPAFRLPPDLAQRDPFNARDCGWVEQMRPFIRQFAQPGQLVLDPFCGFGTTLVAAHLEERRGIGIEIDRLRASIAIDRLQRIGARGQDVLAGDAAGIAPSLPAVQLILTSLPYFGCRWSGESAAEPQLYGATTYTDFLERLRCIFAVLKPVLSEGGWMVVMAQNLYLGKHFVPLAWDAARLLAERYELLDERILAYDRPRQPMPSTSARGNRAHEYALIARRQPRSIDLDDTLDCLKALAIDHPEFVVYGSFARWLRSSAVPHLPSDADLLVPDDAEKVGALVFWFERHGFRATRWGVPMHGALSAVAIERAHYVRLERLRADGRLCLVDLCFEDSRLRFDEAYARAQLVDGLKIFVPAA